MLTKEEHKERHILLHKSLDELLADFIAHSSDNRVSSLPLGVLLKWSYKQTKELDHKPD